MTIARQHNNVYTSFSFGADDTVLKIIASNLFQVNMDVDQQ